MSSILESSESLSSTSNIIGGLDIVGFDNKENNLQGTDQSDSISGGQLNDVISGGAGFDFIDGQGGDDVIHGGEDIDFLMGNQGDDTISGNGGDDLILGGAGNDVISGGAGNDNLYGGEGKDTFVLEFFDNGTDTINDFQVNEDKILIKGVNADAEVNYDDITGKLSVNGQEVANLQPGLDFTDENYDIF
ncbi:MAG: hypothetical protein QNJ32_07525 [Xenococcaceae cyanobacterium MO_167.B27]|nr:hypothetical protein [Xenococcaceae cyanobacterium MO_167.B27]